MSTAGQDFYGRTGQPMSIDEYERRFGKSNCLANLNLGDNVTIVTDGQFVDNETLKKLKEMAYQLCLAIEKLPASVEATNLSIQAANIHQKLDYISR